MQIDRGPLPKCFLFLGLACAFVEAGWAQANPQLDRTQHAKEKADGAITLNLSDSGFSQRTIRIEEGKILLLIRNQTFNPRLSFRLDRSDTAARGPALREADFDQKANRWREIVDLNAGTYTVSVQGQPRWSCTIVVVAKPKK
jgi:hypothetical protein